MRLTFFDRNPPRRPPLVFPSESNMHKYYEDYLLRVYLYMARDLPAADDTGLADPFVILRCAGEKEQSKALKETLNPGWFQTVEMKVHIPKIGNDKFPFPSVSLLVYDEDSWGRKDLLGRALMDLRGVQKKVEEGDSLVPYSLYNEPQWYEVYFDALKEQKGFILAGFGLLKIENQLRYPLMSIVPPTIPGTLNVVCIGIRDLLSAINIIPLKRLSVKFDISGDTQEAMESNKHPVQYNSCNIVEILKVPIDIPLNPLYSPVLSVYVYDHILGFIGTRLVGICHIPLDKVVKRSLQSMLDHRRSGISDKMVEDTIRLDHDVEFPADEADRDKIKLEKARMNTSLDQLEIMISQGLVDLKVEDVDTDEEAVNEALKEITAENKNDDSEAEGELDEEYSDIHSFEESEEEEDSHLSDDASDQRKGTLNSNDIALGFEDEEEDEGGNDSSYEPNDEDESSRTFKNATSSASQYSSPSISRKRESMLSKKSFPRNSNKSGVYGITKRESSVESSMNDEYMPHGEREAKLRKLKSNTKMMDKVSIKKGVKDKREIEKALTGFGQRKDKIKKMAMEKLLGKKFKEDVKAKDNRLDEERKKKVELDNKELKNDEKRRKLKTKQNKNVSTRAENTDDEENFDMTPEYLINRDRYEDELEDELITKKPYYKQNVLRGQTRGMKGWFFKKVANTQEICGLFKCITEIQTPDYDEKVFREKYKLFLEPTSLVCRLYILKAKSLTPNDNKDSDPYLYIKCGPKIIDDEVNVIENTNNPGFYKHFDIVASIPGASTLTIQVWDDDGIIGDDFIGETKIDLEERFFSKQWREFNDHYPDKKMPIEERVLTKKTSIAPQGVLECWIELMTNKEAKSRKPVDVRPFPREPFELRVIIWGTKEVRFGDTVTEANDLYVKGKFANVELDTDTHWRCREKGSFNWRMKYKYEYPFDYDEEYGKNIMHFSLWDRDITRSNEMI